MRINVELQLLHMAQSVGNDIKEYLSRTGISQDYVKADGSVQWICWCQNYDSVEHQ